MEFIILSIILSIIALLVGTKGIVCYDYNNGLQKPLYDEKTLIIMKTYDLITDEQYNQMLSTIKQNI